MHAEVLRSEEEPELTVSDWNPEEEGQQNQAETIYDPEAGVTVTLRDICQYRRQYCHPAGG